MGGTPGASFRSCGQPDSPVLPAARRGHQISACIGVWVRTRVVASMSRKLIITFSCIALVSLSGCGLPTHTPDLQEFWGTSEDANKKVKLVVKQVKCELTRAVRLIVRDDIDDALKYGQPRSMDWLKTWAVDASFLFTIDEKSSFNPGVSFNTPMQNAITSFPGAALPVTAPLTATNSALTRIAATTPQTFSFSVGGGLSSEGYRQDKVHILYPLSQLIGPEEALPERAVGVMAESVPNRTLP
jgi:hypothetical protein